MSLKQTIISQFSNPQGFLGYLAGTIMAHRPSNQERNRWTVALLDIHPEDTVLEIGFGPGFAIQCVSQMLKGGKVIGIDHSETMLKQASLRNREGIQNALVELRLGSIDQLPPFGQPFNKIFSANSVQFWPNPVESFKKLKTLLAPEGKIATTFQPRKKNATNQDAETMGNRIMDDLKQAGFYKIELEIKAMNPVNTVCVMGYNDF